jgi:hypothetical protein
MSMQASPRAHSLLEGTVQTTQGGPRELGLGETG